MTDHAPNGSTPKVDNNTTLSPVNRPDKPNVFGERKLGQVVVTSNPERGAKLDSDIDFTYKQETELMDLLLELYTPLTNAHAGKDTTQLDEAIKEIFPQWNQRKDELILYELEIKERERLENLPYPQLSLGQTLDTILNGTYSKSKSLTDQLRTLIGSPIARRHKMTISEQYEQNVKDEKEIAAQLLHADKNDSKAMESKQRFIQKVREKYKWYDLHDEVIENRLKVYVSETPQYIFKSGHELMLAYQFVEQAEKRIAYQFASDLTVDGTRQFDFDLNVSKIDIIAEASQDSRMSQAVKDLGKKFGLSNMDDFWDWVGTLSTSALVANQNALNFIFLNSAIGNKISPDAAGTIGGIIGAGVGLGSVYVFRKIYRKIRDDWYYKFPDEKQGITTPHELKIIPIDAFKQDLGPTNDPIRKKFRGRAKDAGRILAAADEFRHNLANGLYLHNPDTLDPWLSLSDRVLGESTLGEELPYRIALSEKIEEILIQEFPANNAKKHLELGEIKNIKLRNDLVYRAIDIVSQFTGNNEIAEILKRVARAKANGEKLPDDINTKLTEMAAKIKSGDEVFHPKEGVVSVEEKEKEVKSAKSKSEKQDTSQAQYKTTLTNITTAEEAVRTKEDALQTARDQKGKRKTATEPGEGEIGDLENRKETARLRYEKAFTDNGGYDSTTNTITGLLKNLEDAKAQLATADVTVVNSKANQDSLEKNLTRLIKELSDNRGLPDQVKDKKTGKWYDNPMKLTLDGIKKKQMEIDLLEDPDPNKKGSVAHAKQQYVLAQTEKGIRQAQVTSYQDLYDKNSVVIELYSEQNPNKEGTEAWFDEKIQAGEKEIKDAELALDVEKRTLKKNTDERDNLLKEIYDLDPADPGFSVPSEERIAEIVQKAKDNATKLQTELDDLNKKKEANQALVTSEEDLERAEAIERISSAPSQVFTENAALNTLCEEILEGNLKVEDLAKTFNNEGYNLLLRRIFGADAVTDRFASRILSKARLAETIIDTWQIADDAKIDSFFNGRTGDPDFGKFQKAQKYLSEITEIQSKIVREDKTKPDGKTNIRKLNEELSRRQNERNKALSELYDSRLSALLSQDRVRTNQVVRKTISKITQSAIDGNPFESIMVINIPGGTLTEQFTTSQGQVTISEAKRDDLTKTLIDRGGFNTDKIGNTGFSAKIKLTNDSPEGKIDTVMRMELNSDTINKLPETLTPALVTTMPPEISGLAYGSVLRRLPDVDPGADMAAFTTMYNSISINYPTRQDAITAGLPSNFVDFFYGSNLTDAVESNGNVISNLSGTDLTGILPIDPANVNGMTPEMTSYFYKTQLNTRRNINEITAFLSSLPADEATAITQGIPSAIRTQIYENGTRKDPVQLKEININRNGAQSFNNADELENLLGVAGFAEIPNNYFTEIGESFIQMSKTDRIKKLQTRLTTIPGIGDLELNFDATSGEFKVNYNDAGTIYTATIEDFNNWTQAAQGNVDIHIGNYLFQHPEKQNELVRALGKQGIEAMRKIAN